MSRTRTVKYYFALFCFLMPFSLAGWLVGLGLKTDFAAAWEIVRRYTTHTVLPILGAIGIAIFIAEKMKWIPRT